MLEALLSSKKANAVGNISPQVFNDSNSLLYMTMGDLVDRSPKNNPMTSNGTGVINTTVQSKDGSPAFFSGLNGWLSSSNLALLSSIDVGDYTIDMDWFNSNVAAGYKHMFCANFMTLRIGNAGFGNRLQFGADLSTLAGCWSLADTYATLPNRWIHFTIQRKAGFCRIWIDGVLQTVRNNNYSGAPATGFSDSTKVGTQTVFRLGHDTSGSASNEGAYFDNWEISNVARY